MGKVTVVFLFNLTILNDCHDCSKNLGVLFMHVSN